MFPEKGQLHTGPTEMTRLCTFSSEPSLEDEKKEALDALTDTKSRFSEAMKEQEKEMDELRAQLTAAKGQYGEKERMFRELKVS